MNLDTIRSAIANEFHREIVGSEQIYSGNSRVLRLQCREGEFFIAKVYPSDRRDSRDRLGVEFGGLSFLWKHGIRAVPRPLYADRAGNFALYEFIPGTSIPADQVDSADVSAAVAFLGDLTVLRDESESDSLPAASEACFSCGCYLQSIERRLQNLTAIQAETALHQEAIAYLHQEFIPFWGEMERWYRRQFADFHIDAGEKISSWQRTLSPSDFGFHNAIRRQDGTLIFVDFEYFGWDDPAKMIADFIHHPARPLACELYGEFLNGILAAFPQDPSLEFRIDMVYPVLGMKWCLIMLNEFLASPLERRLAANGSLVIEDLLRAQLVKSREKLDQIRASLGDSITDEILIQSGAAVC